MHMVPTALIRPKQGMVTRVAAWYLGTCPFVRGRGVVNRLLGTFLKVRLRDDVTCRLINPLEYHQRKLLFGEAYEAEVTSFLLAVLRPGMVFVDVGANLGYYTLLGARGVGFEGRVHAFEPAPVQFEHLSLNVRVNRLSNVVLNDCALAEDDGEVKLFMSDGWNHGTHSMGQGVGGQRVCVVRCTSLDLYVASQGITRLDVVKMDVEGAELRVLRGGRRTIEQLKPQVVLFEASEVLARSLGDSTREVKEFLESRGYVIFRLEPAFELRRAKASEEETYANLVALHSAADRMYYEALGAVVGSATVLGSRKPR